MDFRQVAFPHRHLQFRLQHWTFFWLVLSRMCFPHQHCQCRFSILSRIVRRNCSEPRSMWCSSGGNFACWELPLHLLSHHLDGKLNHDLLQHLDGTPRNLVHHWIGTPHHLSQLLDGRLHHLPDCPRQHLSLEVGEAYSATPANEQLNRVKFFTLRPRDSTIWTILPDAVSLVASFQTSPVTNSADQFFKLFITDRDLQQCSWIEEEKKKVKKKVTEQWIGLSAATFDDNQVCTRHS